MIRFLMRKKKLNLLTFFKGKIDCNKYDTTEKCHLLLLGVHTFSVHVIVLSVAHFCCACRKVIAATSCCVMNEEEVHGGGDGGHTGGVPGPPGGAGVDFHVRAHTTIRSYDNRKSKY